MTEIFKAWQCIGCGRIDGPQNCVGICQDRKAEFVYAAEHAAAVARAEQAEQRARSLETLVRRLAFTRPRADEWQRCYSTLQGQARELLAASHAPASAGQ